MGTLYKSWTKLLELELYTSEACPFGLLHETDAHRIKSLVNNKLTPVASDTKVGI